MVNNMFLKKIHPALWQCHKNPPKQFYLLFNTKIPAGFPSPADDYIDQSLDLNEHLVWRPSATFFLRVEGESMINVGMHPNDIIIVDRSIKAISGSVVVAAIDGQFTVKILEKADGKIYLNPANPNFSKITIEENMELIIWGVVTNVIHSFMRRKI